ncbi:MAG: transposase, partial [Planctomycetales bacterium]|nr:transposase [Planctomycetales bacterium]
YHESDHVLNFAYNALCDGTCLEDMELRRTDEAYLDGLGARRTPDPTTAGDFCRRFEEHDVRTLMEVFDETRLKVWQRQPAEFFAEAQIDMDGTLVETGAEKMQGIDISYNGVWGYHPLVVSLANTGEVLSVVNRSGNRPSHEGAAAEADKAIAVCRRAGLLTAALPCFAPMSRPCSYCDCSKRATATRSRGTNFASRFGLGCQLSPGRDRFQSLP